MPKTRVHETPNAVMTTLASPSLNGSRLAVWRALLGVAVAQGDIAPFVQLAR